MPSDVWLLDVHDDGTGSFVVWLRTVGGEARPHRVRAPCVLHVEASAERLRALSVWLDQPEVRLHHGILHSREVNLRTSLEATAPSPVLEILLERPRDRLRLARTIDDRGLHRHHVLHSVDVEPVQAWLGEHNLRLFGGVRPCGDAWEEGGTPEVLADMRVLRMEGQWRGPMLDGHLEGAVVRVVDAVDFTPHGPDLSVLLNGPDDLQRLLNLVRAEDPDIVLTDGGDAHLFPALQGLADGWSVPLVLGRTEAPLPAPTRRTTVHSYGRLLRRGGHHRLEGRVHIDLSTSFLGREAGLPGLVELCASSGRTLDAVARRSPGAVISAIQIQTVLQDGVLVPWRKNRPEDTSTGWDLLHADRGGLHLDPHPGVHAEVVELDFASLYPSIIATRNISPETLGCTCCRPSDDAPLVPLDPDEARTWFRSRASRRHLEGASWPPPAGLRVPGLPLHTCSQRHGMLGRVVAPLIRRRHQLKRQSTAPGDEADRRQKALKWLLVTCFGYTGYRNARFGRIEAHEAICAWARDVMIHGVEAARSHGWEVVHGIVDSLWVVDRSDRTPATIESEAAALAAHIGALTGVPLEVEGRFPVLAILPRRRDGAGALTRYWGCGLSGVKVRGIEARQHSTSPFVRRFQIEALEELRSRVLDHGLNDTSTLEGVLLEAHERARLRLVRGDVCLDDLLVARRVERGLAGRQAVTSLQRALRRSERLGWPVALGSRLRFVEVDADDEGVLLDCELVGAGPFPALDLEVHLRRLDRAAWSLLGPFGWTFEALRRPAGQRRLPLQGQA